ncbi:MAG: peroxiredoxin [Deltaproteobacteria bacterium]|nr:peroxiredoxin [Deltaproteobacteria bacterium]
MGSIRVGVPAPDFTLRSQSGEEVTLSKLRDKRVVLFFYPKDETPGCTAEACSFRDQYDVFAEKGAEVIGISADSEQSHARFAAKNRLQMTLLSDPDGAVRTLYGVKATLGLFPGRVTFVIDREGVVRHVFSSQLFATKHVDEALKALDQMA